MNLIPKKLAEENVFVHFRQTLPQTDNKKRATPIFVEPLF